MPIKRNQFVVPGPWGGVNELVSSRHIGQTELASAQNVVNRDGRITTRPGYALVQNAGLSFVIKQLLDTTSFGIAVDGVGGKAYYTTTSTVVETDLSLLNPGNVVTGGVSITRIALDVGSYLFYVDSNKIVRVDWGTWANKTTLYTSSSGVPRGIAVYNAAGLVYFSEDSASGSVKSVPIAGGASVTLLTGVGSGISGMAVTPDGSTVMWCSTGVVSKSSTATPAAVTIATQGTDNLANVGYYLTTNRVYFGNQSSDRILSVKLDGTGLLTVASVNVFNNSTIGIDATNGQLYYSTGTGSQSNMGKIDIDTTRYDIVSMFNINRNFKGIASTELSRDIRLIQLLSQSLNESELMAWMPTQDHLYRMNLGFQSASVPGQANRFVTNNRDAPVFASLGTGPLSTKSGRHHYEAVGSMFEDGRGGVVICDGNDGVVDSNDQPFLFNYTLGDTIWTVVVDAMAGNFIMSFDGVDAAAISFDASEFTVNVNLVSFDAIDGVYVDRTVNGNVRTWMIRIHGAWSGQNTPSLTAKNDSGGTPLFGNGIQSVTRTQTGGTDTDAFLYCVPVGLPKPVAGSGSGGFTGDRQPNGLTGIYSYAVTWYSSRWRMESPPVEIGGTIGSTTLFDLVNQRVNITLNTAVPQTIYFDDTTVPFRHIDYYRVYRRKWGETHTNGVPDGVGATGKWEFIGEKYIPQLGGTLILGDNGLDTGVDEIPFSNGYPPRNAQFSASHQGRHFYGNARDRLVWWSEFTKNGLINKGQLGFAYVGIDSNFDPARAMATDAAVTAITSVGNSLLVGMSSTPIRVNTSTIPSLGIPTLRAMEGVVGPASAWMIVPSDERGPDARQTAFWVASNGYVYEFDGARSQRLSGSLKQTALATVRRYTHDPEDWAAANLKDSWYWNSMIVDPIENRILYSYYPTVADVGQAIQVAAMNLDNGAWTPGWTIPGKAWLIARDSGTGQPIILFSVSSGDLMKLLDGADDSGAIFACSYSTRNFSLGDGTHPKTIAETGLIFEFERRSFGGAAPSLTLAAILDGVAAATNPGAKPLSDDWPGLPVQGGVRRLQLSVSWTHDDLVTHPELVGLGWDYAADGQRSQR